MNFFYLKKKILLISLGFLIFVFLVNLVSSPIELVNDYEVFSEEIIKEEKVTTEGLINIPPFMTDEGFNKSSNETVGLGVKDGIINKSSEIKDKESDSEPQLTNEVFGEELGLVYVKVVDVVDGDTIKVNFNNKVESVRIIGIDTPETVHPSKPVECFGIEASNHAKKLLSGAIVGLEIDNTQGNRDKYNRLLAYVIMEDGRDFGEEMIGAGYAFEYTYNLPYKNQIKYKSVQTLAKENGLGLWAEGVCDDFVAKMTSKQTPSETERVEGCTIKGNINAKGEKIYHVVGQQFYNKTIIDETKGERWFCSEDEAVLAGWRKSKV